jgi:hypothetical protein
MGPGYFYGGQEPELCFPDGSIQKSKKSIVCAVVASSFIKVNDPTIIEWTATSSECGNYCIFISDLTTHDDEGERTLRIRTTEAFAGGRPMITVNSWSPKKLPPRR